MLPAVWIGSSLDTHWRGPLYVDTVRPPLFDPSRPTKTRRFYANCRARAPRDPGGQPQIRSGMSTVRSARRWKLLATMVALASGRSPPRPPRTFRLSARRIVAERLRHLPRESLRRSLRIDGREVGSPAVVGMASRKGTVSMSLRCPGAGPVDRSLGSDRVAGAGLARTGGNRDSRARSRLTARRIRAG